MQDASKLDRNIAFHEQMKAFFNSCSVFFLTKNGINVVEYIFSDLLL